MWCVAHRWGDPSPTQCLSFDQLVLLVCQTRAWGHQCEVGCGNWQPLGHLQWVTNDPLCLPQTSKEQGGLHPSSPSQTPFPWQQETIKENCRSPSLSCPYPPSTCPGAPLGLSVHPPLAHSFHEHPSVHPSTCLSIHHSIHLPIHLSMCPPVLLPTYPPIHLSICPSFHVSIYPSFHPSVHRTVHLSIHQSGSAVRCNVLFLAAI